MENRYKRFLDTVHGYISIPEKYCNTIIDTEAFQRLRRIEQTSARSLFPCARHDRFIHSLGVFHIGSEIFQHIKDTFAADECDVDWNKLRVTYEIACLLHDCGHAPFSHTFEKYYDKPAKLTKVLKELAGDNIFSSECDDQLEAAPHERLSAILVLQRFKDVIDDLGGDALLAARMIIGCKYIEGRLGRDKKLANCFISLLHGRVIDADRLDYVCRDKWASGYSSNSVDIERLIKSVHLQKKGEEYIICYDKNALNEIQSVLDVKDFQQLWVINHHKVVYEQFVLDKAIEQLAILMSPDLAKEDALSVLFNYKSFITPQKIGPHIIYIPSDDDLIHLLKQYMEENEYAREWFGRQHQLVPVWKSMAEFSSYFGTDASADLLDENGWLYKSSKQTVMDFLKENAAPEKCEYIKATPKIKTIGPNEVFININKRIVCYTKLNLPHKVSSINFFFYLFIPKSMKAKKGELITKLKRKLNALA